MLVLVRWGKPGELVSVELTNRGPHPDGFGVMFLSSIFLFARNSREIEAIRKMKDRKSYLAAGVATVSQRSRVAVLNAVSVAEAAFSVGGSLLTRPKT